jgi:hypothetical protein
MSLLRRVPRQRAAQSACMRAAQHLAAVAALVLGSLLSLRSRLTALVLVTARWRTG